MDGTAENVKAKRRLPNECGLYGFGKSSTATLGCVVFSVVRGRNRTAKSGCATKTFYLPAKLLAIPAAMGISNFSCWYAFTMRRTHRMSPKSPMRV